MSLNVPKVQEITWTRPQIGSEPSPELLVRAQIGRQRFLSSIEATPDE
ncbi:hypothetical protein [Streptomyces sp. NPDC048606]